MLAYWCKRGQMWGGRVFAEGNVNFANVLQVCESLSVVKSFGERGNRIPAVK
jgi:hypothetical protein